MNNRNSRKISYYSQGMSNDGCPWICNYLVSGTLSRERRRRMPLIAYTSVGASSLPSDIDRAMREASIRRTATDTDSYAFFVNQSNPIPGEESTEPSLTNHLII